jgi:mannose-6-phosphate isomerase-like protein (cupin superfamily)
VSYVRRISPADATSTGYPKYQASLTTAMESVTIVSGYLDDDAHPPLHVHDVDQFFVVLGGSATMWLAREAHETTTGELIYIPAGYPHGSENHSGASEHHIEIMVPGVRPGEQYLRPIESADAVPLPAASPYVKSVSGPATTESGQEKRWVLADGSTGIHAAQITAVEHTGPWVPGDPVSQDTDRLIIVTEGQLATEIAASPGPAPAEAVIIIPAGVPHRIGSTSSARVRYLDISVQPPSAYAKLVPNDSEPRLCPSSIQPRQSSSRPLTSGGGSRPARRPTAWRRPPWQAARTRTAPTW